MAESFTNQAREQAESKSSFFKREKILGEFRTRRSNITGSKFKKGTSQQSVDNIEKRVGINEKKITLLKNIGNLRKDNQKKQFNSPLLESLQSIASTVDSIRNTLIQQQDNDKGIAEDMRREKEEKERKDQEKGLEAPKPLQKMADKVIAPVMSLWGRIWKFISTIFLGKILMNFLDWFGNPENQGKITTLIRFVKDWWPALVGAVLLFGTGFGGLVTGLTVAIASFIPKMLGAIKLLKASKLGGKAGLLKGGLLLGGGILAGMGISKMMDKGEDVSKQKVQGLADGGVAGGSSYDQIMRETTVDTFETKEKGVVTGSGKSISVRNATPEERKASYAEKGIPSMELWDGSVVPDFGKMGADQFVQGMEMVRGDLTDPKKIKEHDQFMANNQFAQPDELQRFINRSVPGSTAQVLGDMGDDISARAKAGAFVGGGKVRGERGVDRVPAMLTHGESVLQVGARERMMNTIGVDPLAFNVGPNANKPKYVDGKVYAKTGGTFTYKSPLQQFNELREEKNDIRRRYGRTKRKDWSKEDRERYSEILNKMNKIRAQAQTTKKLTSEVIAKEKTEENKVKKEKKLASGSVKFTGSQLKNLLEEQKGIGEVKPVGGNIEGKVNTALEVKPKEKKNVVIAYEQEGNKEKQQKTAPPPGGNDIPSFDVRPPFMTDQDKLMVLGMRV